MSAEHPAVSDTVWAGGCRRCWSIAFVMPVPQWVAPSEASTRDAAHPARVSQKRAACALGPPGAG